MTGQPSTFASLGDGNKLVSRAAAICARKGLRYLSIGLRLDNRTLLVETDDAGVPRAIEPAQCAYARAGCLAKTITASLLAETVAAGKIDWNTKVTEALDIRGTAARGLSGITLGQLLDHTHGLDSPLPDLVPVTNDGRIDVTALCAHLAARSLTQPGEMYSYGNVGAWFAGAILERTTGKPYQQLVSRTHLLPRGKDSPQPQCAEICPATGATLELTTAQWLTFLEHHLHAGHAHELTSLRTRRITMPGWSPAEQAACLGWKYYGGDWFGHNANMEDLSALLRFDTRQRIAIVIMATNGAAYFALASLFGTALPELAGLRVPPLLGEPERATLEPERFSGVFSRARSQLEITIAAGGGLAFTLEGCESGDHKTHGRLRPAQDNIFFPDPSGGAELAFIQFVRSRHSQTLDYLWNGKQLWRRE